MTWLVAHRWHLAGAAVLLVVAALWWRRPAKLAQAAVGPLPEAAMDLPALPRRVTVQVLNGTRIPRLAAALGMPQLRRVGLDVVSSGDATDEQRAAGVTLVLVRRGDTTGVGRVLLLYPKAVVRDEPRATLLVDLTVVLGPDAAPAGAR
ncbi:MAG: LytR C-terminal domain-containing protein [Gemmatimonadales bacterium]|nr:LytR C-terminal domain-containing protein [Gemmatimonadales bacterium]